MGFNPYFLGAHAAKLNNRRFVPSSIARDTQVYYSAHDRCRAISAAVSWLEGYDSVKAPVSHDPVNNPSHYTSDQSGVECIQVAEHMNFCRGNALKYLWRAGKKSNEVEDLKKAIWYIQREIDRLEKPQ